MDAVHVDLCGRSLLIPAKNSAVMQIISIQETSKNEQQYKMSNTIITSGLVALTPNALTWVLLTELSAITLYCTDIETRIHTIAASFIIF
jgi:hypothetical protein